jgi:hypothetical protein
MTHRQRADELTLAEELLLLCHRRDTRTRKAPALNSAGSIWYAVQAALIVELIELDAVAVRPLQGPFADHRFALHQTSSKSTGYGPRDALLAEIGESAHRPKPLKSWLSPTTAASLVFTELLDRGVVVQSRERVGILRSVYRVEPVDLDLDSEIRDHFESVFFDDGVATDRDCLLAALIMDGFLADYYAPLRDRKAQLRFMARANELADLRRPPRSTLKLGEGDAITLVLTTLGHINV